MDLFMDPTITITDPDAMLQAERFYTLNEISEFLSPPD